MTNYKADQINKPEGAGDLVASKQTASSAGRKLTDALSTFLRSKWLAPSAFFLAAALPFVTATPYALSVMTTAAVFVMLCAGLNVVVGYCGLLDLGYAAFFAVGAYVSGIIATRTDLSMIETVPFVIGASILAGLMIGLPALRLRSDYLAIVTLGFGEILRITANNIDITGGPSGIYGIPSISIGGYAFDSPATLYYFTLVVVAVAVVGAARLGRGRLGRAWLCVREDEDAAEAMGINTYRVKLAAYVTGAVWGGLAGVLFASQLSAISPPSFTFLQSALVLIAVVLGGMGNTPGVVLGAVFVSVAPEFMRGFSDWRLLAFGILLIVVMIFRPQGLWPSRVVAQQMKVEK